MSKKFRTEKDTLGDYPVPADAWYGIQTARAVDNFPISGRGPDRDFIIAHARIKRAAATANREAGWLDARLADAINKAADAVIAGEHHAEFVVDRFQAGAGTSHNMNTNEVIANLASVALGGNKGAYQPVHPNDHVNMGQSTNDTIPTAIRLACLAKLPRLLAAVEAMAAEYEAIAKREAQTIKSGRTHLQDAVPTTLGREFGAYAAALRRGTETLKATRPLLCEVGLGGSAAGTGLNTARRAMPNAPRASWRVSPASRSNPPTTSRPPCSPWPTCSSSPMPSGRWRSNSRASATTCACSPPARAPASAKSCCRRCSPAPRSCPARSTR